MQGKLYPEHELRITPIMNIDMMMIALSDNNPRNMCVLIGIARASAKIIPYAAKADYLSAPIDLLILFAVDKLGLYGTKIIDFNTACGHNSENAAAVLHAEELGVVKKETIHAIVDAVSKGKPAIWDVDDIVRKLQSRVSELMKTSSMRIVPDAVGEPSKTPGGNAPKVG